MSNMKVWPHLTIVAILCAVIAGLGVAFYLKHEQTAQAEALPYAARIQRVDGDVAFNNALATEGQNYDANGNWVAAMPNQPMSVGDRIYTRENAHTSLAFSGRNFARLNPNTSLDLIDLNDRRTQLALREGSAIFDVGYLNPGELFEVGTPYGAVDFDQPGLYNVGLGNGNAVVSVLSGLAQVVGLGGTGQINKGEMLTLLGTTAAQVVLSRLNGNDAGYLVDDYYRNQYPNYYDGRYNNNYDAYLNDPYYYDPYRRDVSYQYAPAIIPGLNDLAYYGDWQNVDGYGYAWRPREDAGWVPYQQGYWVNDYPYGPTWVSSEAWGYAPYHYGRWANVGNQWYWVPDSVNTTPQYAPALVAFLPLDANQVGWVPLAPGDPYTARYYDSNWQPYYVNGNNTIASQLVNLAVPNAVTVVPVDSWGRQIDRRSITTFNPQTLAQVRPVLDPLLLTPLRNAVVHSAWGRGKIDLPPGIAKKLYETSVITSVTPVAPPFRKDLARSLRVQQVPERAKGQKLNFKDDRGGNQARGQQGEQPEAARAQQDAERQQRMATLAAAAAQGNKDARKQARQLEQEQRKQQAEGQRAQRVEAAQAQRVTEQAQRAQQRQQAQGERVSRPARPAARPEAPRPQVQRAPQVERQQRPAPQPRPGPPARVQQQQAAPRPQPVQAQRQGPPARAEQQQAAPKPERQGPPAKAPGPGGGGGGKGKGKGKP
jgi:hypothetical protein